MRILAVFDVTNDRRRRKLVLLLQGYLQRVQKSVFEGFISKTQYKELCEKSEKVIDEEEDSIRYYPICSTCSSGMELRGINDVIEDHDFLII